MTSTFNGIAPSDNWENLPRRDRKGKDNVGKTERVLTGLAGVALVAFGIRRGRLRRVLLPLGGTLITRAITGRPSMRKDRTGGRTSPLASVKRGQGTKVEESITVNRPVREVYRFWRNFENLPRFMDHLESVTVLDENRSHWIAKAPAGAKVEWDAAIHNEIENELIAWRSLPGSDVNHAGSVRFTPIAAGNRTEVRVALNYEAPAGKLGVLVAKLLGEEPSQQVEEDLRRFKQVVEGADITGTGGIQQPVGRA